MKLELELAINKLWTGDAIEAGIKYGQSPSQARHDTLISAIRGDLYLTYVEPVVIEALLEFAMREDILALIGEEIMEVAGLLNRVSPAAALQLLAAEGLTNELFFEICEGSRIADEFGLDCTILESNSDQPLEVARELERLDGERLARLGLSHG